MDDVGPMDRVWVWLQWSVLLLVAWWAGLHSAFRVLLVLQVLDVITGVLAAARAKSLRSRIGAAGIKRKTAAWLLIVALAYIQHELIGLVDMPNTGSLGVAQWSAAGLAIMEFVSISENVARMGVPLPGWLRQMLAETASKFGYERKP